MSQESLAILESLAMASAPRVRETCEVVREISALDVPILLQEMKEHNWTKGASTQPSVHVLRTSHHQLAQLLASDVDPETASFVTGRSVASIRSLQSDPAFQELLAYYAAQQEQRDLNVYDRLVTVGVTALDILQQRIEESPEKFTNNDLMKLLESTMDRSAAPAKGGPRAGAPSGTGLNVSINFVPSARAPATIEAEMIGEMKQIEEDK